LPAGGVQSIFQDSRGRVWVSTLGGVGYSDNGRFVVVNGLPGGLTRAIVEDSRGSVWIANPDLGLFRVASGRSNVEQIPWARLKHKDQVTALAEDPSQGGLWLGFFQGGVAYLSDGQLRASFAAADGLGEGRVSALHADPDGTLWAATEGGLSRLKNGRVVTLTSKNGLPCDAVGWVLEDDARSLWLGMACGLVRMARDDVDAWAAAANKSK